MLTNMTIEELMVITILMKVYEEGMKTKYGEVDYTFFYPLEWEYAFSPLDKINILKEAIENNCLVINTNEYVNKCEGVIL